MSTVVRPSGPLPARVYWVRRLLLLVVVLGLLWALVAIIGGGDDPASGEPKAADPTAESTPEPTDEAPVPAQSAAEVRREKRQTRREQRAERRELERVQTVSQSLEAATEPCDLTLVQAVPQVTEPAYARSEVMMRIGLRTAQGTACTLALDPDRLLVAVHSAEGAAVWSSTECPGSVPTRDVVLRPYWTATVDLLWTGTRSARSCAADKRYAAPGDYALQVAALAGEPASYDFTLAEPVVRPPAGEGRPLDEDAQDREGDEPDGQVPGDGRGPEDEREAQQPDGQQEGTDDEAARGEPADR